MPRPGALRRRVRLELRQDIVDEAGGSTRSWTFVGHVFAEITPLRSRETITEGRAVGLVTHEINMRWRSDVDGNCRIVDGVRVYRILSVQAADPRRAYLACLCEEDQT